MQQILCTVLQVLSRNVLWKLLIIPNTLNQFSSNLTQGGETSKNSAVVECKDGKAWNKTGKIGGKNEIFFPGFSFFPKAV